MNTRQESTPGKIGGLISSHRNSEGELVTIERVRGGEFSDRLVLCVYDDDTSAVAPTLLDSGLHRWLTDQLREAHARGEFA